MSGLADQHHGLTPTGVRLFIKRGNYTRLDDTQQERKNHVQDHF